MGRINTSVASIIRELDHNVRIAQDRHNAFPTDHMRALGLLAEEFGEVARAVVDATRTNTPPGDVSNRLIETELELFDVAVIAVEWIQKLRELRRKEQT